MDYIQWPFELNPIFVKNVCSSLKSGGIALIDYSIATPFCELLESGRDDHFKRLLSKDGYKQFLKDTKGQDFDDVYFVNSLFAKLIYQTFGDKKLRVLSVPSVRKTVSENYVPQDDNVIIQKI